MKNKAFSLVEIIIAIAVLTILATISFPAYKGLQNSSRFFSAEKKTIQAIRFAKQASVSMIEDDNWSLKIENKKLTIFKGSNWQNRDNNFDTEINLPGSIIFSGDDEINFSKLSGEPGTTKQITLSYDDKQKNININQKGIAIY